MKAFIATKPFGKKHRLCDHFIDRQESVGTVSQHEAVCSEGHTIQYWAEAVPILVFVNEGSTYSLTGGIREKETAKRGGTQLAGL